MKTEKEKLDLIKRLHVELIEYCEHFGIAEITEYRLQEFFKSKVGNEELGLEYKDILKQFQNRVLGWGPVTEWLENPEISEIMINGKNNVFVERLGKLESMGDIFLDEEEIYTIINRMVGLVGRRIDASSPMVDARLPDGSRINAIIPPLSLTGPVLTIRKFPTRTFTLKDLAGKQTLSENLGDFLERSVKNKLNIIVSGGTGSGKTTTLNALAGLIPSSERVVTIEDSAELRIEHPHLVSLESRTVNLEGRGEVSVRMLLKNALRMRPDRIIVGEIRSAEALDMLHAMNTGHPGSLTTVHANSPLEALFRIEGLALMSELGLPLYAIREQISQAVNLVIQQSRMRDGSRKIVAVDYLKNGISDKSSSYELVRLYEYDKAKNVEIIHPAMEEINKSFFE